MQITHIGKTVASRPWVLRKVLCALILYTAAASGQVKKFENKPIVDIQFTPPSTLDAADLAKALPFQKGDRLHADDVASAIDALFATGCFRDIVVEAEPSGDGVVVRFVTQLTLFVASVKVEGKAATPPNRAQIHSAAQLALGTPLADDDISHAQTAIEELLKANGFYESTVTPQVSRDEAQQQVFITFQVAERRRARYDYPIIQGRPDLSDSTIIKATGWRVPIIRWWRQVTASRTRNGVQRLLSRYQRQDRLNAEVQVSKLDYDAERRRVRPTLDITPGPRVKVEALETKVSRGTLKKYVPIFQVHAVDTDLLVQGQSNLIDYFQGRGYYDADVTFRILPENNGVETIEYVIARGERYKLEKISIVGNHYFSADTIRERMYMEPASFLFGRGRYSDAFQRKDEADIADLYRSNGFRDVKVNCAVTRNYEGKRGHIAVTVEIDEGPQWLVNAISFKGVHQVDSGLLLARCTSTAGQPFAEVDLAIDRNEVLTYYYEHGFPNATFQATWAPAAEPQRVNVTYTVMEGNRIFVRRVITRGLRTTRPSLVQKKITFKPGDPLSPVEETNIQKNLYDLGVFARVDTAVQNSDGDTQHKYVLYDIEEASRYTVGWGLGLMAGRFSTPGGNVLSSPGGSLGISPEASVDLTRLNFLGTGQLVGLHGLYSILEQRGTLTYQLPNFLGVTGRSVTFSVLYDNALNVQTFASRREEASVEGTQKVSKALTATLRFAYRRVSVNDVIIPVLLVPQFEQAIRIGMLSGNFVYDHRDNPSNPHRGMYNTAEFGLAGGFFGSQRNFARVLLRNATYYPLTKSIVLARQTQFGVIEPFSPPAGISAQQSVPLPERFLGGGPDTLRAFPFDEAGPRDTGAALVPGGAASQPTGLPLGGNALFYNNVELRFPLIGSNIGGVIFHDMGNIFSSLSDISLRFNQRNLQDFNYTVQDVGFGIRYKTPVGPIRLDLAYGLNPPSFIGFSGTPEQLLTCNPNVTATSGPCAVGRQSISHFQFFFSIGQTF